MILVIVGELHQAARFLCRSYQVFCLRLIFNYKQYKWGVESN